MRNLHNPSRSPIYSKNAMVATSHPDATKKALDIMEKGGNAFDAAVCAAAVLAVVEAHSTGIGGDCFCLFYSQKKKKVIALNGSGTTPKNINYDNIKLVDQNNIDPYCINAITIPGAVAAWQKLISDYGNLKFKNILEPAIELAENGYIIADVVADMWKRQEVMLNKDKDCRRIFLKNGKAYKVGDLHKQLELAETFKKIAKQGKDGFYEGEVAKDIINKIKSLGGSLDFEDLSNYTAEYVEPIKINYKGYDIYECPPNGQGIVALMILNILSNFDLVNYDPESINRIHLEAEASKLAFLHRNKYLGDPNFSEIPLEQMLSIEYGKKLSTNIKMDKIIKNININPYNNANKDTVYVSVVDKERNHVSFINSIFHPFGSGIIAPNSGVLLHNRGASFNLNKGHPNFFSPGKRPMHTIIPGLLLKGEKPIMPFGVMGAHYQPVGQAHFLTNVIDYGMDVQLALDNPRSFCYEGRLELEKTFSKDILLGLDLLGHNVSYCDLPHGGGQAIYNRENNVLVGGSDPRKDGIALGY